MKLLPSRPPPICWAAPRSSTLRVSSVSFMPSYLALFSLVARNALPFGSRKLRAKPSLTRTMSPIWPRRPTRSSRMTSMGGLLWVEGCEVWADFPFRRARGAGRPEERHEQERPAENGDRRIDADQHDRAALQPARDSMQHRKAERRV